MSDHTNHLDADATDEQLMGSFARGSTDAFQVLFRRYRQPVFGFFRRRLLDTAQAEELAQETFLAVLRARGRYQATSLFRSYLYAIAFRILRAHRRKTVLRAMFTGKLPERFEAGHDPGTEASLVLRQAVSRLDPTDREIVLLREYEELSYIEIAEVLQIPANTVRSRLFRARAALRALLNEPAPAAEANGLTRVEGRA